MLLFVEYTCEIQNYALWDIPLCLMTKVFGHRQSFEVYYFTCALCSPMIMITVMVKGRGLWTSPLEKFCQLRQSTKVTHTYMCCKERLANITYLNIHHSLTKRRIIVLLLTNSIFLLHCFVLNCF